MDIQDIEQISLTTYKDNLLTILSYYHVTPGGFANYNYNNKNDNI